MADQSGKETSDDLIPHDMSPNKITRDSMFFVAVSWAVVGDVMARVA